jgi:hypothetical protein
LKTRQSILALTVSALIVGGAAGSAAADPVRLVLRPTNSAGSAVTQTAGSLGSSTLSVWTGIETTTAKRLSQTQPLSETPGPFPGSSTGSETGGSGGFGGLGGDLGDTGVRIWPLEPVPPLPMDGGAILPTLDPSTDAFSSAGTTQFLTDPYSGQGGYSSPDPVTVVPLPSAAWAGLTLIPAIAAGRWARRRRLAR